MRRSRTNATPAGKQSGGTRAGGRPGAAKPVHVVTDAAPPPVGPYPHAIRCGNLVFVSGMGPRRPGRSTIPGVLLDAAGRVVAHDVREQTRAAIENVAAVLEAAGSSLARVIDVTAYLTDMAADFAAFNEVYAEYFATIRPARTTVGVTALPTPIAVELKVIALAGKQD